MKMKNKVRCIRIITVFSITAMIVLAGVFYQSYNTANDLKNYVAPGKIYNVDGGKHHIHCLGGGEPTVILEAGLGESSLSWYPVQRKIAEVTRVCSYDRPGLGWSEAANSPMSLKKMSKHLHHLLKNAAIAPPYIMVGHSRGGIYVRNYFHEYKGDIAGIILLDSTHEQGPARIYPYDKFGYLKQKVQTLIAIPLSRLGVIRLFGWADVNKEATPLPEKILEAKSAIQNRTDTAEAVVNEINVMRRGLDNETSPPRSLGDLPLVVITAGKTISASSKLVTSENKVYSDNLAKIQKIKMEMQKELAALSENSTHIIARESGHYLMFDQPELVIQSLTDMVAVLR